jgi:hypothetical protein
MKNNFVNKKFLFLLLAPLLHKKFLELAKIAFHQKIRVPSQTCDRSYRKKVESCNLTDSLIRDCIEQTALARVAVKKNYFKGAKNYRNKI